MKYKNNPGNVRSSNSHWLGSIEPKNGFCQFCSIEYGVRVILYLLTKTYYNRGIRTLEDCIKTYCPKGDGNNDPDYYVRYVCADDSIHPLSLVRFLRDDLLFLLVSRMCFLESHTIISRAVFDKAKSLL